MVLDRILATLRYVNGIRGFLRETITETKARSMVEQQLAAREQAFLGTMRDAVFAQPRSPYYKLLQQARIQIDDITSWVEESGIEATLERLLAAGVYVTQDELKGRVPIRREGLEFTVKPRDFDNPLLGRAEVQTRSSGSTGAAQSTGVQFDDVEYRVAQQVLGRHIRAGIRPMAVWNEDTARSILRYGKMGVRLDALFTTVGIRWSKDGLHEQLLLRGTLIATRLAGHPMPAPKVVPKEDVLTIARWLASKTRQGTPAALSCHASPAVRICLAARENNLDISGTLFYMGAEPFTPAKAAVLTSAGASAIPNYSTNETGAIAFGCGTGQAVDDLHLLADKLALVHQEHLTPAGETVQALIFTTLLSSSSKILINAFSGDYATIEQRNCGCALGEIGLTTHLSGIRSYEKLTAEGVTFAGSQLFNLVEEVLPSRFGGHVYDYQLAEEESEDGIPRLCIVVSPGVGPVDEQGIIETVLKVLESSHRRDGGAVMAAQWRQGNTLRVVRREPEMGRNSKILPLRALSWTQKPSPSDEAKVGVASS